jgi:predicted XRE-type DNA-binding protein
MIGKTVFDIFEQLGDPKAEELAAKAEAVSFLRAQKASLGLTQAEMATRLGAGWDQSRVSDLLSGKLSKFSVTKINEALAIFGHPGIEIHYLFRLPDAAE